MGRLEDRRKEMNSGGVPRINVDYKLDMGMNDKNEPSFVFYDKIKERKVFSTAPLTGILIGRGGLMQMSAYDRDSKKYYNSSFYSANKDNIVLFEGGKVVKKDTVVNCENSLRLLRLIPKKKQVLFVLTEKGLYSIITNIVISIYQMNKIKKRDAHVFAEKFIVLNPKRYDPNSVEYSKDVHNILSISVAQNNMPYFASIEVGADLTEEILDRYNESYYMKMYNDYVDFLKNPSLEEEISVSEDNVSVKEIEAPIHPKPAENSSHKSMYPQTPKKEIGVMEELAQLEADFVANGANMSESFDPNPDDLPF